MFLERVGNHPRCCINYDPSHFVLQQLDYLEFIDIYHERIKAFHVKDAEFNPTGRQGVYSRLPGLGRTAPAASARSATARSISAAIFSKLAAYDYDGWAVLEWECCLKHPEDGAREGARVHRAATSSGSPRSAFDDFAGGGDRRRPPTDACSASTEGAMTIEGTQRERRRRIRLGMVGGGQGAFIGAVHRLAARWTTSYELVAGALSSDPERAQALGAPSSASRRTAAYGDFEEMARARGARGRTASRWSRSSRRTTCTAPSPRRSSKPAST